jgi:hypothetical protein
MSKEGASLKIYPPRELVRTPKLPPESSKDTEEVTLPESIMFSGAANHRYEVTLRGEVSKVVITKGLNTNKHGVAFWDVPQDFFALAEKKITVSADGVPDTYISLLSVEEAQAKGAAAQRAYLQQRENLRQAAVVALKTETSEFGSSKGERINVVGKPRMKNFESGGRAIQYKIEDCTIGGVLEARVLDMDGNTLGLSVPEKLVGKNASESSEESLHSVAVKPGFQGPALLELTTYVQNGREKVYTVVPFTVYPRKTNAPETVLDVEEKPKKAASKAKTKAVEQQRGILPHVDVTVNERGKTWGIVDLKANFDQRVGQITTLVDKNGTAVKLEYQSPDVTRALLLAENAPYQISVEGYQQPPQEGSLGGVIHFTQEINARAFTLPKAEPEAQEAVNYPFLIETGKEAGQVNLKLRASNTEKIRIRVEDTAEGAIKGVNRSLPTYPLDKTDRTGITFFPNQTSRAHRVIVETLNGGNKVKKSEAFTITTENLLVPEKIDQESARRAEIAPRILNTLVPGGEVDMLLRMPPGYEASSLLMVDTDKGMKTFTRKWTQAPDLTELMSQQNKLVVPENTIVGSKAKIVVFAKGPNSHHVESFLLTRTIGKKPVEEALPQEPVENFFKGFPVEVITAAAIVAETQGSTAPVIKASADLDNKTDAVRREMDEKSKKSIEARSAFYTSLREARNLTSQLLSASKGDGISSGQLSALKEGIYNLLTAVGMSRNFVMNANGQLNSFIQDAKFSASMDVRNALQAFHNYLDEFTGREEFTFPSESDETRITSEAVKMLKVIEERETVDGIASSLIIRSLTEEAPDSQRLAHYHELGDDFLPRRKIAPPDSK